MEGFPAVCPQEKAIRTGAQVPGTCYVLPCGTIVRLPRLTVFDNHSFLQGTVVNTSE